MIEMRLRFRRLCGNAAVVIALCAAATGQASELESDASEPAAQAMSSKPAGFHLGHPRVSLSVRTGMNFPAAHSDVFDMVTRELTIRRSDFRSATIAVDAAFSLSAHSHWALVAGFGYCGSSTPSEVRDYVDERDLPITQTTRLTHMPITGGIRLYPARQGEAVGNLTWIANRAAPFVTLGGGVTRYEFEQFGDFVDFTDITIFRDRLASSGWAPTIYIQGGLDLRLTQLVFLTFETQYAWAKQNLDVNFRGFEPIDLRGLRTTVGVAFKF